VILDSEMQREMLLELIKQTSFSGQSLDAAYQLKQSIEHAKIKEG